MNICTNKGNANEGRHVYWTQESLGLNLDTEIFLIVHSICLAFSLNTSNFMLSQTDVLQNLHAVVLRLNVSICVCHHIQQWVWWVLSTLNLTVCHQIILLKGDKFSFSVTVKKVYFPTYRPHYILYFSLIFISWTGVFLI